jgi:hypothetical protein
MKLCFLIPYGKNKRKKRGSGSRKMGRKSDNLKSAPSFVSLVHFIPTIRRAVAARSSVVNNPPPVTSNPTPKPAVPQPPAIRRDKKLLKGVVVKRKTKFLPAANEAAKGTTGDKQPDAKRRKLSPS